MLINIWWWDELIKWFFLTKEMIAIKMFYFSRMCVYLSVHLNSSLLRYIVE